MLNVSHIKLVEGKQERWCGKVCLNLISILFIIKKKIPVLLLFVEVGTYKQEKKTKTNSSEFFYYFHIYFLVIRVGGCEVQLSIKFTFDLDE